MKYWIAMLFAMLSAMVMAASNERAVKRVQFPQGEREVTIRGSIKSYNYIDYQLRAGAGQTMRISLKASNRASYFNLLPPKSVDAAMARGELDNNHFAGLLPDDGIYTIRVFLLRSAARRNEASDFQLHVGIDGRPLSPVSPKVDAVFPGTPYHAKTTVKCKPQYTQTRECEALVIRRGFDGTATVELRWDNNIKRRILFIQGEPKAADLPSVMTFSRDERGWRVNFNGDDEYFDIPESLVFGG